MNTSDEGCHDAGDAGNTGASRDGRLRSIALIVIFDVALPLVAYSLLRRAGWTTVSALLASGVFPAIAVAINVIQHRRLDVVGALVLAGIIVGTALGLITHNARLVLVEGSVPTAVFGVACLGSLRGRRPLMFSFALEFTGPGSAKGREMTQLWQYAEFRHIFRVITTAWGAGFLLEAVLRVVIVYNTSAGTALSISKFMPFVFAGIMCAWTAAYTAHLKKKGGPLPEVSGIPAPETAQADPASPETPQATA